MPRAGLNFNLIADPEDNFHNYIFPCLDVPLSKLKKTFKHVTLNTKISLSIQ